MKPLFALIAFILLQINVYAQSTFVISGTVKNAKGEALPSATVFIASTQKITATNANGDFEFNGLIAGNYQVVVNLLGYKSVKQDVTIADKAIKLELILIDKEIALKEVVIGAKQQSPKDMKTFVRYFMGLSVDAKSYKILNPEVIDFVRTDTMLTATTSDFLIIDNYQLGYRIKYLLKRFYKHDKRNSSYYEGDAVFEPLKGTDAQLAEWTAKRKKAYYGSRMHFYRSVYAGTARKEGFLIYKHVPGKGLFTTIERDPSDVEQFVQRPDSNYINLKINPWVLLVYDKEKAVKPDEPKSDKTKKFLMLDWNENEIYLDAKVDSRGSLADIKNLFYGGGWAFRRVADQLPFEYQPE